jgi:CBS-domain-containing membrane protein
MAVSAIPHRMTVADVMTREVVTIIPETPVKMVGELLRRYNVSGLPVVDATGLIVGIVTEADLLLGSEGATGERFEPLTSPRRERVERAKATAETAAEAMTSPAVVITCNAPLAAAARMMRKHGIKRLPVVDNDDRLIGILGRRDILSSLARPDEEIHRDVVEGVITAWLWLSPTDLDVSVLDGIVTIAGTFERRSEVDIARHLVEGLDGVVAVHSRMAYRWDDTKVRPAAERRFE